MRHLARNVLGLAAALVAAAAAAQAQAATVACTHPRLDPPTCEAYQAIVDSAHKAKLPTAPLEDKMNQGLLSESDGPSIIAAVRKLEHNLSDAKKALGPATDDELKEGAEALDVGVPANVLARFRADTPSPHKRSLACALLVVTGLIADNVPIVNATSNVEYLVKESITDVVLQKYQSDVHSQIVEHHGAPDIVANALARAVPLPAIHR